MTGRKVFEEVDRRVETDSVVTKVASFEVNRPVLIWFAIVLSLTLMTIIVGGITRLTDSGLSITEWKPVTGMIPPFNESGWQTEFAKYRETAEFINQNFAMTMAEFRTIYWWEWAHRMMGRAVGIAWLFGFVWFILSKQLTGHSTRRAAAVGGLIAVQGVVGWWMVASGLTKTALDVAPYRLAIHLGLALVIAGLTFWEILLLNRPRHELFQARRSRNRRLDQAAGWMIALLLLQLLAGALVAGHDAGAYFPTWPLMNGEFLPSDSFNDMPWPINFIGNPALVHFNHRILGYLTLVAAIYLWAISRRSGLRTVMNVCNWLLFTTFVQMGLGIATTLTAAQPAAALIHQVTAIILFHVALWLRYEARFPRRMIR